MIFTRSRRAAAGERVRRRRGVIGTAHVGDTGRAPPKSAGRSIRVSQRVPPVHPTGDKYAICSIRFVRKTSPVEISRDHCGEHDVRQYSFTIGNNRDLFLIRVVNYLANIHSNINTKSLYDIEQYKKYKRKSAVDWES